MVFFSREMFEGGQHAEVATDTFLSYKITDLDLQN